MYIDLSGTFIVRISLMIKMNPRDLRLDVRSSCDEAIYSTFAALAP
jgi:hypothetical protein